MMKILRNDRGETLIEVLASILIAALSVALLFTCVMASSRMEQSARKKDAEHYNAFTEADIQVTPTPAAGAAPVPTGNVTISRVEPGPDPDPTPSPLATATPPIGFYGGEGMFSYKR